MRLFKKKPEPAALVETGGFFATSHQQPRSQTSIFELQKILARSFQKPINALKPVDAKGNAIEGIATMDSACITSNDAMVNGLDFLPEAQLSWYASQGFIGYQMCALISQNWLVDKACAMPAKDAMRNGYDVTVNDGTEVKPEVIEEIRKADKRFGINKHGVEFVRNGRIFGVRVAMFIVDGIDYTAPFNPDGVTAGSYKGISQIDPYWITPELDADSAANPSSQHFYEPTYWRINGKRVHRTHLVVMRNGEVPDLLKPSYMYGGISVPQRIAERVYAAERTANEAPLLAMTKRLTVMNVDTEKALANYSAFQDKMSLWVRLMNNFGVKIIGGKETIEQFDTSLADLDAVIMTQYQIVAAASGVPATKLLGTSPKGFNATGEFEEASYHEELESIQSHDLSPLIERHHLLLIRSEIAPKFQMQPFSVELNWRPVDSPTAAEAADINLKKAQTDSALANVGAIDGADIRNRLIADRDSGYNGMEAINDEGTDEDDDADLTDEA